MGSRYILTVTCPKCGLVDDDVFYAPTSGFLDWKCRCGHVVDLETYSGINAESTATTSAGVDAIRRLREDHGASEGGKEWTTNVDLIRDARQTAQQPYVTMNGLEVPINTDVTFFARSRRLLVELADALEAAEAQVARLAKIEAAAQVFFASDSWCVGLRDHVSAKACPCGYAQLRAAFETAAPTEDAP